MDHLSGLILCHHVLAIEKREHRPGGEDFVDLYRPSPTMRALRRFGRFFKQRR